MRNAISALKKFQPATIISILALFIAIGGSATAASSLINGKNIKRGTISTKQLKNKSITKAKLKPATIKALKGKRGPEGSPGETGPAGEPGATGAAGPVGPKGATGAPGAKGATGAKGPAGIVKPEYVRSAGNTNLDSNGVMVPLITDNLPGGKYAVTAKVSVMAGGKGALSCRLVVDGQTVDEMVWDAGAVFDRGGVFLQTVTPSGTEKVRILCASLSASMQVSQKSIVSLPVS